ncbi:MAG: hypothetical protein IT258_09060, partial [Saprospiraceae bacterium]|nr:hypothetical protein [Saprospiraceae bacterium]
MKNQLTLLGFFLASLQWAMAQCPPPGYPTPADNCSEAVPFCGTLDGFCNTLNNNNIQQPFPGCGGQWVFNNDEWFAFYAGSTEISLQVTPSNCDVSGNPGMQGG